MCVQRIGGRAFRTFLSHKSATKSVLTEITHTHTPLRRRYLAIIRVFEDISPRKTARRDDKLARESNRDTNNGGLLFCSSRGTGRSAKRDNSFDARRTLRENSPYAPIQTSAANHFALAANKWTQKPPAVLSDS